MIPVHKRKGDAPSSKSKQKKADDEPPPEQDAVSLRKKFDRAARYNYHQPVVREDYPKQAPAMKFAIDKGVLPLFARDHGSGKQFMTASYKDFFALYKRKTITKRIHYELIYGAMPTHLYIDLDADLKLNPTFTLASIEAQLLLSVKNKYVQMGYCKAAADVDVFILDSSQTGIKTSRHYIFKMKSGALFENLMHCGAFMRRLRLDIQHAYGAEPEKNPFFIKTYIRGKLSWEFVCDLTVYTVNREFRLPYSTKPVTPPRPFIPVDATGNPVFASFAAFTESDFTTYLVQSDARFDAPLVTCTESDDSPPRSTNKLDLYRLDRQPTTKSRAPVHREIPQKTTDVTPERARAHYSTQYPFDLIWKLFGDARREFAFTTTTGIFKRRFTFTSADEMRKTVLDELPAIIHIGAVFNERPMRDAPLSEDRVAESFLKFDVDLTDYLYPNRTPIRGCCGAERKCCEKCWGLLMIARVILHHYLVDNYGIAEEDVQFYFSGGRGLHAWVFCPNMARHPAAARRRIIDYIAGGPRNIHDFPAVQKLFDVKRLTECCRALDVDVGMYKTKADMLELVWPRIDDKPTVNLAHLMKSPYSLHANGRAVIPFNEVRFPLK